MASAAKDKRKDQGHGVGTLMSPRPISIEDCDEERNKNDDLQLKSIQRSIVSETMKKPHNFNNSGVIKSGDMSGCSKNDLQMLDTDQS